jgi:RNA polymerase sigma factor (TIGR02999 family)
MTSILPEEVTNLLDAVRAGDPEAPNRLFEVVYQELRKEASHLMDKEPVDHILQPTALVNETYMRLVDQGVLSKADNRRYFFAAAARIMRQILVEYARARAADKRGGGRQRVPLDAVLDHFEEQNMDVLELHEALDRLAAIHERQSQVVELHFFVGLTWEEVAAHLGVSTDTVRRDFRIARAWLHKELGG